MVAVLIAANLALFILELILEGRGELTPFLRRWTLVPAELTANPGREWHTIFSAMFIHGGWAHLMGNLAFLAIFGPAVEALLGRARFAFLYVMSGVVAAAVQVATATTASSPNLGASGAVAGVLGAAVLPWRPVKSWLALLAFALWFGTGLLQAPGTFGLPGAATSTPAIGAHLGGFAAGLLLVHLFLKPSIERMPESKIQNRQSKI